jgi:hypothetical protein
MLGQTGLFATALSPLVQNARADEDDLSRIEDQAMLSRFVSAKLLVPVPASSRHYYIKGIPAKHRYLRPWSKQFLDHVAAQYYARFRKRLRVTSMVRTEQSQLRLATYNTNAAPASGPTQSSHLTGATLDISKAPMGPAERQWMRGVLAQLKAKGYAYGIEERVQPTFHVMIYKNYPAYLAAQVKVTPAKVVKKRAKAVRTKRVARKHRR